MLIELSIICVSMTYLQSYAQEPKKIGHGNMADSKYLNQLLGCRIKHILRILTNSLPCNNISSTILSKNNV